MAARGAAGQGQDVQGGPVVGAGVARGGQQQATWAQRLGSTLPTRLNRNVLEIVLEKDENVSESCKRLGWILTLGLMSRLSRFAPMGKESS